MIGIVILKKARASIGRCFSRPLLAGLSDVGQACALTPKPVRRDSVPRMGMDGPMRESAPMGDDVVIIQGVWQLTDEAGNLDTGALSVAMQPMSRWHTVHRIFLPAWDAPPRRLSLEIQIPCDASWSLSGGRELEPVAGPTLPPAPVGRFVIVQRGKRLCRIEFPWATKIRLVRRGASLLVHADLVDVAACGLSRWGPSKVSPSATRALDVFEDSLRSLDDCLWIEPFPDGARAALCLTDHPDFDSAEKLRPLVDLFARLDLRFTKGVFPAREPLGHKQEPGVDVPEYARLVDELFERGNEIAFHGIGPRPRPPGIEEFRRRLERMRRFSPSTWIDHGVGEYLFSRRAMLEGGESLVDVLGEVGIANYWSYVDSWSNPFGDLSSDSVRSDADAVRDFLHAMVIVSGSARGVKGLFYPASHLANNLVGENGALELRGQPLQPSKWRAAVASRRAHRAGSERPTPLYGLDGAGFALTESPVWVFDTILLSHPAFQLSPIAIDRLCASSGLSLVHCYLTCTHPYIGGGCFARGRTDTLHPSFVDNMEHVAERQRAGDLCVMPLRDLRSALVDFRRARLERVEGGWCFAERSTGAKVTIGCLPSAFGRLRCEKGSKFGGGRSRLRVTAEAGLVLAL